MAALKRRGTAPSLKILPVEQLPFPSFNGVNPVPTEMRRSCRLAAGQITEDSLKAIDMGLFARTPPSCRGPNPGTVFVLKNLAYNQQWHLVLSRITHHGAATLQRALRIVRC